MIRVRANSTLAPRPGFSRDRSSAATQVSLFPTTIADLVVFLDAKAEKDAGVADASLISTWTDQSGNGHHATAAGSARPAMGYSHIETGEPYVLFDGTTDCMSLTSMSQAASGWTFFCVARYTGANIAKCILDIETGRLILYANLSAQSGYQSGGLNYLIGPQMSGFDLKTWRFGSSVGEMWNNGVLQGSAGVYADVAWGSSHKLGAYYDSGGAFFAGEMGCFLAYDRALETSEVDDINDYLVDRYNTT